MHVNNLNENIAFRIELQHCVEFTTCLCCYGCHSESIKHDFDQYFTERKQKYHLESGSYE